MSDLGKLKSEIDALSPAAKLRLAADLLEAKRPELAHAIAEKVVIELGAALALLPRLAIPATGKLKG